MEWAWNRLCIPSKLMLRVQQGRKLPCQTTTMNLQLWEFICGAMHFILHNGRLCFR